MHATPTPPTPFDLVNQAKSDTTKIEGLRKSFENELHSMLPANIDPGLYQSLFKRSRDGGSYVDSHIDAFWFGFQRGGSYVGHQVKDSLRELSDNPATPRNTENSPLDPLRPNAGVVSQSHYPGRPNESVDWVAPLFDSDGYPHTLVALGAVQAVTKVSFAFAVWDRKTLTCNVDGHELRLGNTPMSSEERARRKAEGLALLRSLDASKPEPANTHSAPSFSMQG
ncbi:MAG: hypothetical protein EPN64_06285 [Burkholderiaceae bacterium]|nr:MAG: hypothetical protein EPN64_06285 [Burkholderiaceae bacterium]